ncbi:sodium:solute symporter family transporter [Spongiimicrobium sp. 3-5]|uniref:sodium:solute symporter family transporter n=1 Tax=Spongiimicrobium sp. 3-5 TaxID=3332596 RepID=UPI0039808F3D
MNYIGIAVIVFAIITFWISLWTYFKVKGKAVNYFKAGAMMPVWVVGISLVAPAIDANGSIGAAARSAEFGFWSGASIPIGLAACMFLLGRFFAKPIWNMNMMTLADFFGRRYNRTVETLATLTMLVGSVILLAGNIAGLGILFHGVFDLSFVPIVIVLGAGILLYSLTGGFFASLSSSVFQVGIFIIGILSAFFWLTFHYGWEDLLMKLPHDKYSSVGLTQIKNGALQNWAAIISLALGNVVALDLVQRVISAESPRAARKSCYLGGVLILLVGTPVSLIGLYAVYLKKELGFSLLIDLAMENVPVWIGILLVVGVIAASIAVASGVILAMANTMTHNLFQRYSQSVWSDNKLLRTARLMAIPLMVLAIIFACVRPEPGTLLILAFDIVLAGCFVPFVLGIFWKKANSAAAILSVICGVGIRMALFWIVPEDWAGLDTLLAPVFSCVLFVGVAITTQERSPPRSDAFKRALSKEELVAGKY